jgi:type 1 fimbria pilin
MRHSSRLIAAGCLLFLVATQALATTVTVSVTIVAPPPCVINGGKLIEVKFGDEVMTSRIDGSNYETLVPFTLVCTGQSKNAMKFKITGAAGFETGTLATEQTALAIRLLNHNVKFSLNEWNDFDYATTKPILSAVPVKQSGSTLIAGAFSASATAMVDYQ